MSVSIEKYNLEEINNRHNLSNRLIRAFRPSLFENGGFPTQINREEELVRYVDSMHANSFERHFNKLCEGLTKEEFELLKRCTNKIYDFTKSSYNKDFLVKSPMIASLFELRIIKSILESNKDKRIFEIGGGNGTLGCVILEDGLNYVSTDVTQAFYLLQNRLFNYFLNNNGAIDLVEDRYDEKAKSIHIPYWELWNNRNSPFNTDVIMSNHALLEMHPNALRFYLTFGRESLKNSQNGVFAFQGGGWGIDQNMLDLLKIFDEYGYMLKYFDHSKEVAVFSTGGETLTHDVSKDLKCLFDKGVSTEQIYALGSNITTKMNSNQIYYCDDLGNKIKNYFDTISKEKKVGIDTVKDFYSQFTSATESPDDEFAQYIKLYKKN